MFFCVPLKGGFSLCCGPVSGIFEIFSYPVTGMQSHPLGYKMASRSVAQGNTWALRRVVCCGFNSANLTPLQQPYVLVSLRNALTLQQCYAFTVTVKTKQAKPIIGVKRRGRPKSGQPVRTKRVTCNMIPEDAEWLEEFAADAGFESRGQLLTALLERFRMCGFSPIGMLRVGSQISARLDAREASGKFNRPRGIDWASLSPRPFPPLPEEAPFNRDRMAADLEELQHELANERTK